MKAVIVAEDGDLIREVVEKAGHAVVAQAVDSAHLLAFLLQFTPHFVFLEKCDQAVCDVARWEPIFKRVRFIVLGFQRGTTWSAVIRRALRKGPADIPWQSECLSKREVLFDPAYYALCKPRDFRCPADPTSDDHQSLQAFRLNWLLAAARTVRNRAANYRQATSTLSEFEWTETVYRTIHGSFKSPAYARDLIGHSLGYLAHFVPGVDLDGLPPPVDDPGGFKYLHYVAPAELLYALLCLSIMDCDDHLSRQIYLVAYWRFEGQPAHELMQHSLTAIGTAFTLERIAAAHAEVINWLLDPDTVNRLDTTLPRHLYRALQIFSDWWDVRKVVGDLRRLRCVLEHYHESGDSILPQPLRIPTYAEFLTAATEAFPPNDPNNQNPKP